MNELFSSFFYCLTSVIETDPCVYIFSLLGLALILCGFRKLASA